MRILIGMAMLLAALPVRADVLDLGTYLETMKTDRDLAPVHVFCAGMYRGYAEHLDMPDAPEVRQRLGLPEKLHLMQAFILEARADPDGDRKAIQDSQKKGVRETATHIKEQITLNAMGAGHPMPRGSKIRRDFTFCQTMTSRLIDRAKAKQN